MSTAQWRLSAINVKLELQLELYLENMNILADEQNGFRCNHSCEDHVFSLTTILQNRLHHGKDIFVVFIDFTKAFDSVDRNMLFFKLLDYNINGNTYFAIKKLFCETQNCKRVNSMYTRWFPSLYGVRQGDSLSPTLFSIFLNDITLMINKANLDISISGRNIVILLYVHDIVLLTENEINRQRQLDI